MAQRPPRRWRPRCGGAARTARTAGAIPKPGSRWPTGGWPLVGIVCVVAFLLGAAIIRRLRMQGWFAQRKEPNLLDLLDVVIEQRWLIGAVTATAIAIGGGYAMTAITAVTAQNTLGVTMVDALSAEMVAAQIDACVNDIGVDAVKIGMLGSAEIAHVVADRLQALATAQGASYQQNPALPLDPMGTAKTDQILVKLAVTYLRNAQANALYSPEVTVTATNGGVATLVTPSAPADTMTAIGNGKNSLVFGYNSSNKKKDVQLMLTGTKVGTTTWTITIGGVKKTVTQVFKAK